MPGPPEQWNPFSSSAWAAILGLVRVPLFHRASGTAIGGDHAVLLNGDRGSFEFSAAEDRDLLADDRPLAWSWSAHVRHTVIVDRQRDKLYLRRWDVPTVIRQFEPPSREQGAIELLRVLHDAEPPQAPDVIHRVLGAFRLARDTCGREAPLDAVRVLNGLLLVADGVSRGRINRGAVERARTIGSALDTLGDKERSLAEVDALRKTTLSQDLGVLAHYFLDPDPRTGLVLNPELLLRHASSKLYQEAHLDLERSPQRSFPGMGSTSEPRGRGPRDVRFTPANLARALVQEAIKALRPRPRNHITVLDPACGSGIFLQEMLRELEGTARCGSVGVVGYDVSPLSVCMSRFCLNHAVRDLSRLKAGANVEERDSLRCLWPTSDVVVMNPPFMALTDLQPDRRTGVAEVLGDMQTGRVDISMAFVVKAVQALRPGGVLACVLPGSILHGRSGAAWRERMQHEADIVLMGRFEGYHYFPTSLVETCFLVLRRKSGRGCKQSPVQVVLAEEGAEDAALRALRLPEDDARRASGGVEVFRVEPADATGENWRPLHRGVYEQRRHLLARRLPNVAALFHVRQGAMTGNNEVFVLSMERLGDLPKVERKYFRPAAGTKTIYGGQLHPIEYVFYPYSEDGLLLKSEEDLEREVPTYFRKALKPRRRVLKNRSKIDRWWGLSRFCAWQFARMPRLVSAFFGGSGSIAFDEKGDYVVVAGHGWNWRGPLPGDHPFTSTRLPWAYLALLNSTVFERILSWFSVPLEGGQFRLEPRFLSRIPLPNLAGDEMAPEVIEHLVSIGREVHRGKLEDIRPRLDRVAAEAWGLPLSDCGE